MCMFEYNFLPKISVKSKSEVKLSQTSSEDFLAVNMDLDRDLDAQANLARISHHSTAQSPQHAMKQCEKSVDTSRIPIFRDELLSKDFAHLPYNYTLIGRKALVPWIFSTSIEWAAY